MCTFKKFVWFSLVCDFVMHLIFKFTNIDPWMHGPLELHECIIVWRHDLDSPLQILCAYQIKANGLFKMSLQPIVTTINLSTGPCGRKHILEQEDLNYLDGILLAEPALYLDEIQCKLCEIQDVEVSLATLS